MKITVMKNIENNYTVVVKTDLTNKILSYVKDHTLVEKNEDGKKVTKYLITNTGVKGITDTQMNLPKGAKADEKLSLAIPMECSEELVRAFVAGWQTKAAACEKAILERYAEIKGAMDAVTFVDAPSAADAE